MLPAAAGMTVSTLHGRMLFGMLWLRFFMRATWRYSKKVFAVRRSKSASSSSSPTSAAAALAEGSWVRVGGGGGPGGISVGSFWRSQQEHGDACAPPMAPHKPDTTRKHAVYTCDCMPPHT